MEKYKLYSTTKGYKCKVNRQEIAFLFGLDYSLTLDEINQALKDSKTGYYITK